MRKYGSTHESGHVIGFANKYYTWWIVSDPYEKHMWNGTQLVQEFHYQQNLSFEKDKAIQKMKDNPDVDEFIINEGLQSNSSYTQKLGSIDYDENIFLFGKYKKKKFTDVDDTQYKRWYWGVTKGTDKESSVLKDDLKSLLVEYNGETIFIDKLKDKAMEVYDENFRRRGHFGTEGDDFESYVRFRREWWFDTHYGYMNCYEFVDPDGRLIYYKGSKELDIEENTVYILSGKIKHTRYYSKYHDEYLSETQIQYPKLKKAKDNE